MRVCERCNKPLQAKNNITIDDCISVATKVYLCDECLQKTVTFLNSTDYEYIKNILTKVGYENDIEAHDDKHYLVLSTYGNEVAIEFDDDGKFERITEVH